MKTISIKNNQLFNETKWTVGDVVKKQHSFKAIKYKANSKSYFLPFNGELEKEVETLDDLKKEKIKFLSNSHNRYRLEQCVDDNPDELLLFEIELNENQIIYDFETDSSIYMAINTNNSRVAVMDCKDTELICYIKEDESYYKLIVNLEKMTLIKEDIEPEKIENTNMVFRPDIVIKKYTNNKKHKIYVLGKNADKKTLIDKGIIHKNDVVLYINKENTDKKIMMNNYIKRNKNKTIYLFNTDMFTTFHFAKHISDIHYIIEKEDKLIIS